MWILATLALAASALAMGATAPRALRSFCNEWQGRLGLADWAIDLEIVDQNSLNKDSLGNIQWNAAKKHANIKVLSRWSYHLDPAWAEVDQRKTILHELVHLLLRVTADPDQKNHEEQVAERLAQAIVWNKWH